MERDLAFLKELPTVKAWAKNHEIEGEELDELVRAVSGAQGYVPGGCSPDGDFHYLTVDMERVVYARDDVAREGIAKILEVLKLGGFKMPREG